MENQKEYIQSIENSYKYLIEKKTFEEIYLQNNPDDLYIFFGEVDKDIENEEIDTMILHYEETEEYEKCHQLKCLKK
tara:strand:- start:268 stop:498 length:231 start_codon:yes stop_codon:yes gene_type:complete